MFVMSISIKYSLSMRKAIDTYIVFTIIMHAHVFINF